jgi:hypothetical protein
MNHFFQAFAARFRPPDNYLLEHNVGADGDLLRSLLAVTEPNNLAAGQVRTTVEGNLWMLTPETFRYFLPAFLSLTVEHYDSLRNLVFELIGALTEPTRDDVLQALDRAAQIPVNMGFTAETLRHLRQQQLDWFDSGKPLATYRERVTGLSGRESAAIADFLVAIRDAHAEDFPFREPQIAIERHRARGL